MGNACGGPQRTAAEIERSKQVEEQIKASKKENETTVRILMLGAGESGKSTVVKQMKILHLSGFGSEEREVWAESVRSNLLSCAKALLRAVETLGIKTKFKNSAKILQLEQLLPADLEDMKVIWHDDGINQALVRRAEFQLPDSCEYFFTCMDRILENNYVPQDQDILRCRVQTTGIVETTFSYKKQTIIIVDVGGQRSERRKWIHCFEDVTAVIFVVGISEFDQRLYEDQETNRMHEALELFNVMVNSKWFSEKPIMLFFNKSDIFARKLKDGKSIREAFSEYDGDDSYDDSIKFLEKTFLGTLKGKTNVFVRVTNATDTGNIKEVFDFLVDSIGKAAAEDAGIAF